MSADILYNPEFPHGTRDGFHAGCRGSRCPAAIACRDVARRYAGDYAFARMVDDGMTVEQIVAAENAAAEAARQAERARKPKRVARPFRLDRQPHTDLQIAVHKLHGERLNDMQIAAKLGKSRGHIQSVRMWLRLPVIPRQTNKDRILELYAQKKDDTQIARILNLDRNYVSKVRRDAKLPLIPAPREASIARGEIRRLHGEGLTDAEIAERLDVNRAVIQKRRNNMGLPVNKKAPAKVGASSSQEDA